MNVPKGNNGYDLMSVVFGEDAIAIEYADIDAQGEHFAEKRIIYIEKEHFKADVETLEEHLRDMINDAYSSERD